VSIVRTLTLLGLWLAVASVARDVAATEEALPMRNQAQLVVKIAEYDRHVVARAGTRVVAVLHRSGDAASENCASSMVRELGAFPALAGKPHREIVLDYASPAALAHRVKEEDIAILFVCSGLAGEATNVASTLSGLTVLSLGAGRSLAEKGIVVGLDLVSGRAQMVVNLRQAERQNVAFRPEFLKLARVLP
jgi:hypothetical protein